MLERLRHERDTFWNYADGRANKASMYHLLNDAIGALEKELILKVDDMLPQRQAMLSSEAALRAAALDAAPATENAQTKQIAPLRLKVALEAIPVGAEYRASRYDTDDEHVLHLWSNGQSFDLRATKRKEADVPLLAAAAPATDTETSAKLAAFVESAEQLRKVVEGDRAGAAGPVPPSAPAVERDVLLIKDAADWLAQAFRTSSTTYKLIYRMIGRIRQLETAAAVARSAPPETP